MRRAKLVAAALAACFAVAPGVSPAAEAPAAPVFAGLRKAVEVRPRNGIGNVMAKIAAGEEVTVAYLGGSITAMDGWRRLTTEWLRAEFPKATFREVHAAIGGTGSDLGVFRLEHDALDADPDLLFVEFATNDRHAAPETIWRNMEGIVRKTWRKNPKTDIVFTYTITVAMKQEYGAGQLQRAGSAMDQLADFYGIPSVDFGPRVWAEVAAGRMVMSRGEIETAVPKETPDKDKAIAEKLAKEGKILFAKDGVHPALPGHGFYLKSIQAAFAAMKGLKPVDHAAQLRTCFTPGHREAAKMVPVTREMLTGPDWVEETGSRAASVTHGGWFLDRLGTAWQTGTPGSRLSFTFRGTYCQIYDLVGPAGANIEISVDGKPVTTRARFDSYCTYWRLAVLPVYEGPDGLHEVVLTVSAEQPSRQSVAFRLKDPEKELKTPKYNGTEFCPGALHIVGDLVSPAGEKPDPRVRSFVLPTRIVDRSVAEKKDDGWPARCAAEKMEMLLTPKHGQVCEGYFATDFGPRLVSRGEPAFVIFDFGRELHGALQLGMSRSTSPSAKLRVRFGESVGETCSSIGDGKHASNDHALRDFELPVPRFGTIEVGNTGFRFVRLDLVAGESAGFEFVRAVSLMRPMKQIGSFRSSDARLDRIFDTAVRTVHLCCQDYLWDGIKRDRLVWMGDTHPMTMTILSVYGAARVLPESLDYMAAVTPPDKWMNTMATYTLWWIRNVAAWYRFTGDLAYVKRHAAYLEATFDHVAAFLRDGQGWTGGSFLDWPTKHNPQASVAGTQGLALLTAEDMAFLAEALGKKPLADRARAMSAALRTLRPDPNGAKSAAALLALSGLRDSREMADAVLLKNGHQGVSTFYGYYMLEALSAAGASRRALDTVRDYWGAMLDVGATSFWEDFNLAWTNNCTRLDERPVAGRPDIHGDFGEFCYPGYRHSLCHGWSSGPAPWCLNHVLGIRPLDVGCKTVEVKPFLGDLAWAEGSLALPDGDVVRVRVTKNPDGTLQTDVKAPAWVKIVR